MEAPRIFESAAIKAAVALAKRVGPVDLPVLISGETGTGKEIIAEIIHSSSARAKKEMVCINCAGLPGDLIENELFGSRRGAFTGSVDEKTGLVRLADGSTLFLDELADMPLHLQSKLLRFIQDKRVRKLGGITNETINVRIIAAVNKPPEVCVAENILREDLFYRLSTITINVPPLRDRQADIMPLAKAYLHHFSAQFKRQPPVFSGDAARAMTGYQWPGNVRQLVNEMARCALLCGPSVQCHDLKLYQKPSTSTQLDVQQWVSIDLSTLKIKQQNEVRMIVETLVACDFNQAAAYNKIGISRGTFYAKVKAYGIKTPKDSAPPPSRTRHRNGHVDPVADSTPSRCPAHPAQCDPEQVAE